MDYNWKKIKGQLINYCKVAFDECNIILSDFELEEDVIIFNNFINTPVSNVEIGDFRRNMMEALQQNCVDYIGNSNCLRNIAILIDTFLKKLLSYIGKCPFGDIKNDSEMRLLKKSGLWGSNIPNFQQIDINTFKGNSNGMFILANANLTRNAVAHTAPSWDISQVTYNLRYILGFYIFLIHSFKTELLSINADLSKHDEKYFDDNEEYALLYDYFSYGNSSIEIKRRYVCTYVKHQLFRSGLASENDLVDIMKRFSDGSLDDYASKRILSDMTKSEEIQVAKHYPKTYELTENERNRIIEAQDNYNNSLHRYNTSMEDIIQKYNVVASVDEINSLVMKNLESLYNYDINEALGDADNTQKEDYRKLEGQLKGFGCSDDEALNMYKDILSLNKDNDIIVRISAGRSFQNISDPEKFNEYVRKAERDVWIDTQILLYLLCYNESYQAYDHQYYKTAMSLFKQQKINQNFHFKVPSFYRNEVRYQLRQALLLISVVDLPFAKNRYISQNVFYRHYCYLRDNEGLPQEVESFSDYMVDNFNLYEEDAFDEDYKIILNEVIKDKFSEFNINIENIENISAEDITISERIFQKIAEDEGVNAKQGRLLKNDATMGVFLFSNSNGQKPIFVTLDNSFEPYRKTYVRKYIRIGAFNWHLFSPSAFVNHMDFINFKVNSENLTDDLISMIENTEYKDKTINVIDQFNRFLDIPHISNNQRKKYIGWVSSLFQSMEFSYKPETKQEETSSNIMRFLDAQDSVYSHFCDKKESNLKSFLEMLQDENRFFEYLSLLKEFTQSAEASKEDLYYKVDIKLQIYLESNDISKS